MQYLVYNVRYTVIPINTLLFTITLYSSVRNTLISVSFTTMYPMSTVFHCTRASTTVTSNLVFLNDLYNKIKTLFNGHEIFEAV